MALSISTFYDAELDYFEFTNSEARGDYAVSENLGAFVVHFTDQKEIQGIEVISGASNIIDEHFLNDDGFTVELPMFDEDTPDWVEEYDGTVLESSDFMPFRAWSDWYGDDAVVTFMTVQEHLWDIWFRQCVSHSHSHCDHSDDWEEKLRCKDAERVVDADAFDPSDISIGISEDKGSDDEMASYTIIIPYNFLTPELCNEWIDRLNEQYGHDFKLYVKAWQDLSSGLGGMKQMRVG